MATKNDFYKKYYSQLDGATIVKYVGMTPSDDYGKDFPAFTVKLNTGEVINIEVSQDEEGNGGGFIFGLGLPV
jgi:hypothetical protein